MGLLNFLFGSKPQPPQQPQGLLNAPSGATTKAYQDYAIDMQSQGKAPLAYADWAKQQQPPQPPQK